MKTLIVYYSFTQNNEKLANYIHAQLKCDMAKIETARKRNGFSIFLDLFLNRRTVIKPIGYRLEKYDHIICIAPVWAGKLASPMTSFLRNEKEKIHAFSFATLCGGAEGQKAKLERELTEIVGKKPVKVMELWINSLLKPAHRDSVKYTSGFRIEPDGFSSFENELKDFIAKEHLHEPSGNSEPQHARTQRDKVYDQQF